MMDGLDAALIATYRAAREMSCDQFQDAALGILKTYVPFDSARWATASAAPDGVVFHSAHLVNELPLWSDAYTEIRSKDRAAAYAVSHPATTGNFHFPTYFGSRADAEMRDYTRRYRHEVALITCHRDTSTGLLFNISLFGANPDKPFSERERQVAQSLYPHLMEACVVNQALQMERLRQSIVNRPWSMAVCTSSGHITLAEPAFMRLLHQEWVTSHPSDALPAQLAEYLKSGASGYKGRYGVFRFERSAAVAFVRGRPRQPIDLLSERELVVAKHVCSGLTHKEIAKVMGIAPATARNHVQAIHERMGIRTNAELVAQMKECGL